MIQNAKFYFQIYKNHYKLFQKLFFFIKVNNLDNFFFKCEVRQVGISALKTYSDQKLR